MNKLEGFFELRTLPLPSVPWKRYTGKEAFSDDALWTVRSALSKGADFHLPRKVGVKADEAQAFARELFSKFSSDDYIIYYPYFIAEKSGTLEITPSRAVIEAVRGDLWNLLTHNLRDVTVIEEKGRRHMFGDGAFLTEDERKELLGHAGYLRRRYGTSILIDQSLILEWSYAYETAADGSPKGARKLLFIEMRSVR